MNPFLTNLNLSQNLNPVNPSIRQLLFPIESLGDKMRRIESHLPNFLAIPNPFKEPHHVYKPSKNPDTFVHNDSLINEVDSILKRASAENSFSYLKDQAY